MMEEARRHLPMMEEARVCPPSSIAQGLPPMVECAMAALPASRTDCLLAGEGLGKVWQGCNVQQDTSARSA